MNQSAFKYALIAGKLYVYEKTVEPVELNSSSTPSKLERIVICYLEGIPAEGREQHYLPETQWQQAAEKFTTNARESGTVTSQSPTQDKIALYRSLFKGRDDVHAHGFYGKNERIGYAPTCENEWKRGICPRTQGKRLRVPLAKAKLSHH